MRVHIMLLAATPLATAIGLSLLPTECRRAILPTGFTGQAFRLRLVDYGLLDKEPYPQKSLSEDIIKILEHPISKLLVSLTVTPVLISIPGGYLTLRLLAAHAGLQTNVTTMAPIIIASNVRTSLARNANTQIGSVVKEDVSSEESLITPSLEEHKHLSGNKKITTLSLILSVASVDAFITSLGHWARITVFRKGAQLPEVILSNPIMKMRQILRASFVASSVRYPLAIAQASFLLGANPALEASLVAKGYSVLNSQIIAVSIISLGFGLIKNPLEILIRLMLKQAALNENLSRFLAQAIKDAWSMHGHLMFTRGLHLNIAMSALVFGFIIGVPRAYDEILASVKQYCKVKEPIHLSPNHEARAKSTATTVREAGFFRGSVSRSTPAAPSELTKPSARSVSSH